MKYGTFEFGDKEAAEKLVEKDLIAGAVGKILGHSNPENLPKSDKRTVDLGSSTAEHVSSTPDIPERKINPVRRTISEKEKTIRSIALKQALEPSQPTSSEREEVARIRTLKPPVPVEQMQPIHANQPHKSRAVSREAVRSVEQSSTEELLRAASAIHIEGKTVRKLYETNQIDHRGLVAIVKEGLRGGDVNKTYRNARLGAEAQQGRKIEMRHDDPSFMPADVRPEISDYAKKRVKTITSALQTAQHSTPTSPAEIRKQPSPPTDHGYQQVRSAMRKKRIATITIFTTLTLSGAAAIAWFLFG